MTSLQASTSRLVPLVSCLRKNVPLIFLCIILLTPSVVTTGAPEIVCLLAVTSLRLETLTSTMSLAPLSAVALDSSLMNEKA